MKLMVRKRYQWRPMVRHACLPSWQCGVVVGAWIAIWIFFLIGAGVLMAFENPTRRDNPAAIAMGQTELTFFDSLYFTEVYLTTCGFGDILPVTTGGRIFVTVWSFFGTGLWLMFVSTLVSFLGDWLYVNVILNAKLHRRRAEQRALDDSLATTAICTTEDVEVARSPSPGSGALASVHDTEEEVGVVGASVEVVVVAAVAEEEVEDEGLSESGEHATAPMVTDSEDGNEDKGDDFAFTEDVVKEEKVDAMEQGEKEEEEEEEEKTVENGKKKKKKKKKLKLEKWSDLEDRSVEEDVLSWYALIILNFAALILYFGVHLLGAGVTVALEPDIGNLGQLTSNTFGNIFYLAIMESQTICFGTDYTPKTTEGRAFFLVWHQFSLIASTFLFLSAALAVLRWTKCHLFDIVERLVRKTHRKAVARMERGGSWPLPRPRSKPAVV